MEIIRKQAFSVIGIEGSTDMGEGFVQKLWEQANARFDEVAHLAVRNSFGMPAGVWGAMTDMDRNFAPWSDGFTKGLYLAGVEVHSDAQPPEGWTRWDVPGFEYVKVNAKQPDAFGCGLRYLEANGLALTGAVQDFTDISAGDSYMMFPIRRLETERIFRGVGRRFSTKDGAQYDAIGEMWDRMAARYGRERLCGLGWDWQDDSFCYAVGLADGGGIEADGELQMFEIALPTTGWLSYEGITEELKQIYDVIWSEGPLTYEIERFTDDGCCSIDIYRERK